MKFLILLLILVICMSGCSLAQFQDNRPAMELITRASVGRVLTEHPNMIEPTYRITGAAILAIEAGTIAELGQLENLIVEKIDWTALTFEERDIVIFLVGQVRSDLEARLALRGIDAPAEVKVILTEVLGWINQTAAIRLPATRATP